MSDERYMHDCPVCGSQLQKISPSLEMELMLDYCGTCGGMWFKSGEVRQLRLCSSDVLGKLITLKKQLYTTECSACGHAMTRNSAKCGACGHENKINCPSCNSELERAQSELFTVDVCRSCRGVWFDNIDLSQVWNLQFEDGTQSEGAGVDDAPEEDDDGPTFDTVIAVLRHGKKADSSEADGSEANGKGAKVVFGTIADIVGGMFSASE